MLLAFARQSIAADYSGERLYNYYLRPSDGDGQIALIGRSGLVAQASPGSAVAQMVAMGGALYSVANGTVYKLIGTTLTTVGTVTQGDHVSMASNASQVAIVTGGAYYICNGTTTTAYSTGSLTNPQRVAFQDGYFIVTGTVSGRDDAITVSGLDSGTTFDTLEFAFAENTPDEIRGIISHQKRLYIIGSRTTEVFWNSGDVDFPFTPSQSEVIEKGALSGDVIAQADNSFFWIGQDSRVYRGPQIQAVSTPEIEDQIKASTITGAFPFNDRGSEFYCISRANETSLVFDIRNGIWSEAGTGVGYAPWIATCSAELDGAEYFGTSTGKICTLSKDVFKDDGAVIRSEAISRPVLNNGQYFRASRLYLSASDGQGLGDSEPHVVLETSKDGKNWSAGKLRGLGKRGEFDKVIHWHNLGAFRRAQMKLWVTDAARRDLFGISVDIQ